MREKHSRPRFFLSPYSGRAIKSTGKLFQELNERGYIVDRHPCLYNIRSAERCLKKILRVYPGIYPPSNFMDIPKTYKKGKARGFIIKDARAVGFVNKHGHAKRLRTPIHIQTDTVIPTVHDPHQMFDIMTQPVANSDEQAEVAQQIQNEKPIASKQEHEHSPIVKSLIYNPIQNDYIPVTQDINPEIQKQKLEKQKENLC